MDGWICVKCSGLVNCESGTNQNFWLRSYLMTCRTAQKFAMTVQSITSEKACTDDDKKIKSRKNIKYKKYTNSYKARNKTLIHHCNKINKSITMITMMCVVLFG